MAHNHLHIAHGYHYRFDAVNPIDMELPLQAVAAWNRQSGSLAVNIYPARNERVVVFCAGNVVGRNVNLIPVRVKGSARARSLDHAKLDLDDVPYSVDDAVVFSPKYHSGVPYLSAFRFPTP